MALRKRKIQEMHGDIQDLQTELENRKTKETKLLKHFDAIIEYKNQ